jgi:non-ribosomal peptide synthetase component E (peptide arylation enzyme)
MRVVRSALSVFADSTISAYTEQGWWTDDSLADLVARNATAIQEHLQAGGVSKHDWPELLVLVDELPVAPGGKVRKAELRDDIRRRLAAGTTLSK